LCYGARMSVFRKSLAVTLIMVTLLHAQEGGDTQAQILYAYHTEDTNSLTNLIQEMSAKLRDADDNALRYHLAHAQYRLGELSVGGSHRAESAYSECIDDLKPLLKKDVKSPEALILQGACYGELADLSPMQSVLLRALAAERLQAAAKLEPRNPRLLLIESTQGLEHSKADSERRKEALVQLNAAAQEFDDSSATRVDAPGWGHAEAFLAMGRSCLARGDAIGARNWIEKSLIAAPDYKAAQRQLASLGKH
jgi:hypothetical protein